MCNMVVIPGHEKTFDFQLRNIAMMDYIKDIKGKIELVVSSNKLELKPFTGVGYELRFTDDPLSTDLARRAKLYLKTTHKAPSLLDQASIRRHVMELGIAYLQHQQRLKKIPTYVALAQFPVDGIQVNTVPYGQLYSK